MTKSEFIKDVYQRHKGEPIPITMRRYPRITHEAVNFWFEFFLQELRRCIIENDEVNLYGIGLFAKSPVTERHLKSPEGREIHITPHRRLRFVPGYQLKNAIREELDYEGYQDMVEKYNACARGEYVPGYYIKNRKLYKGNPDDPNENVID